MAGTPEKKRKSVYPRAFERARNACAAGTALALMLLAQLWHQLGPAAGSQPSAAAALACGVALAAALLLAGAAWVAKRASLAGGIAVLATLLAALAGVTFELVPVEGLRVGSVLGLGVCGACAALIAVIVPGVLIPTPDPELRARLEARYPLWVERARMGSLILAGSACATGLAMFDSSNLAPRDAEKLLVLGLLQTLTVAYLIGVTEIGGRVSAIQAIRACFPVAAVELVSAVGLLAFTRQPAYLALALVGFGIPFGLLTRGILEAGFSDPEPETDSDPELDAGSDSELDSDSEDADSDSEDRGSEALDSEDVEIVTLLGFVDNPYPYLKFADLCVLPSRSEGLPNTVLEALYLQTACVATRCAPFMDDIIQEPSNGALVNVEDVDSLAEKLLHRDSYRIAPELLEHTGTVRVAELFE